MKTRTLMIIAMTVLMFAMGSAFAQMGGGGMGFGSGSMMPGPMPGPSPGPNPGPNPGPGMGHMGGGMGYGMNGAGGMVSGMIGNTMDFEYLDVLDPITSTAKAITAFKAFLTASNSSLQISELWEYGTVFKAKLSDTTGSRSIFFSPQQTVMNSSFGDVFCSGSDPGKSKVVLTISIIWIMIHLFSR